MTIENRKVFFIRSIILFYFFIFPQTEFEWWYANFFDNLTVKIGSQSPVRFVAVSLNGLSLQAFSKRRVQSLTTMVEKIPVTYKLNADV